MNCPETVTMDPQEQAGSADGRRVAAFRRELVLSGCDGRLATELAEAYVKRLACVPQRILNGEPGRQVAVVLEIAYAREVLRDVEVAMAAASCNPLAEVLQMGADEAAFTQLRTRVLAAHDALGGIGVGVAATGY